MTLLVGRRVLLVEDESLVAMLAEDMLLELGCEVVVAMRLDKALALARNEVFDLALLDVNLGDARSYPVADLLFERRTPFLFATGYGKQGLEEAYKAVPVLQKPYQPAPLEHLLTRLLIGGAQARKWASAAPCRAYAIPRMGSLSGRSLPLSVPGSGQLGPVTSWRARLFPPKRPGPPVSPKA